jgi:hypothetical protein
VKKLLSLVLAAGLVIATSMGCSGGDTAKKDTKAATPAPAGNGGEKK